MPQIYAETEPLMVEKTSLKVEKTTKKRRHHRRRFFHTNRYLIFINPVSTNLLRLKRVV